MNKMKILVLLVLTISTCFPTFAGGVGSKFLVVLKVFPGCGDYYADYVTAALNNSKVVAVSSVAAIGGKDADTFHVTLSGVGLGTTVVRFVMNQTDYDIMLGVVKVTVTTDRIFIEPSQQPIEFHLKPSGNKAIPSYLDNIPYIFSPCKEVIKIPYRE